MFSKHPNGLIAAALANMGERFGFYIMMAILTLFISAKFGLSETTTGYIYSAFYASIYILALAGGIIADKTKNFKGTILAGLVMMAGEIINVGAGMIIRNNLSYFTFTFPFKEWIAISVVTLILCICIPQIMYIESTLENRQQIYQS